MTLKELEKKNEEVRRRRMIEKQLKENSTEAEKECERIDDEEEENPLKRKKGKKPARRAYMVVENVEEVNNI